MELRVLIHAPRGRDGAVVHGVLTHQGIEALVCATEEDLLASLKEGAAAVILTEEALPDLRRDLVRLVSAAQQRRIEAFILANNRAEGNAPGTIRAVARQWLENES